MVLTALLAWIAVKLAPLSWTLYPLLVLIAAAIVLIALCIEVKRGIELGTSLPGYAGSESATQVHRQQAAAKPTAIPPPMPMDAEVKEPVVAVKPAHRPANLVKPPLQRYLAPIPKEISAPMVFFFMVGISFGHYHLLNLGSNLFGYLAFFSVIFTIKSNVVVGQILHRVNHLPVSRRLVLQKLLFPRAACFVIGCAIGLGGACLLNMTGSVHPIKMVTEPGKRKVEIPERYWRPELSGSTTDEADHAMPILGMTFVLIDPVSIPPDASDKQLAEAIHVAISKVYERSIPREIIQDQYLDSTIDHIASEHDLGVRLMVRSVARDTLLVSLVWAVTNMLSLPLASLRRTRAALSYAPLLFVILIPFITFAALAEASMSPWNSSAWAIASSVIVPIMAFSFMAYQALPANLFVSILMSGALVIGSLRLTTRLLDRFEVGVPESTAGHR
jgi:hypothetical protein